MQMPVTLTRSFDAYKSAETEKELFERLNQKHLDFVYFFADACDDETWCEKHVAFVKASLKWLTHQLFHGNLSIEQAKLAAKAVRERFKGLERWIPKDIVCELQDTTLEINSFLFQTASTYWFQLIRSRCAEKKTNQLALTEVDSSEFKFIEEYAYTGQVEQLWNLTEPEMLKVLLYARICEFDRVVEELEKLLRRYIDKDNYLNYFALADERSFELIKERCCECFNELQNLILLKSLGNRFISAEVISSTEASLEQFPKIKNYVTHFISGPTTCEDPAAIALLKKCPRLISIDLGQTRSFSELPFQLTDLKELVLKGCLWLKDLQLKKICLAFSKLQKLDLTSCSQITSTGWGELTHLSRLTALILARNDTLTDLQFNLILSAARRLHELNLNECKNLTHSSFQVLAASHSRFVSLGLSRTQVGDVELLQIISKMPSLSYLDISRCHNLTEEGIFDALKISYNLSQVKLSRLEVSSGIIEGLKKLKSNLNIVIE